MKQHIRFWNKKNSLIYQFTSWYVWHFITVICLIGIIVMGALSYFLYESTQQELKAMEQKLTVLANKDVENLQEGLDEILYPNYANHFVEIKKNGNVLARSRGWEQTNEEEDRILWFDHFLWDEEMDLIYKRIVPFEGEGEILLKVQLEDELEFLEVIFTILLFTGLFMLLGGTYLIFHLTKKSLRPLLLITDSVDKMQGVSGLKERIPVPDNVHELRDLAQTFNHLLDQLEEQFEREKSFVSNASHELRTPLTAFHGHINLMKRWGKDNPEVLAQSLQAIDEESERMEKMMVQLLTIARNEHLENRKESVDVTELMEQVLNQFHPDHVELTKELKENVILTGVEEQLRQIAVILVENALHYTSKGKVSVQLTETTKDVVLRVSDTGVGIPVEDQEKIFNRFYRVDKNRSRQTGGTGLGLSIAKQLVDNHGGKIHLESEWERGSTFTVVLPKIRT